MTNQAVNIQNLGYTYPPPNPGRQPEPALLGIDLAVEEGEFVAVMGPTGAGKSTLCLALTGLVPQSTGGVFRGNVRVTGLNTRDHPVAELTTRVGIVFQDAESQLFNVSVEDEVAFGPECLGLAVDEIENRVGWALDAVRLADLRSRSPAQLSGGQQRRLAIAATLAMFPRVLVLDEPMAGLDPAGADAVLEAIADLQRRGMTILLATQNADAVAGLADRFVVLDRGRIVLEGAPRDVLGQVDRLHTIGVNVPQVTELSHLLGFSTPFLSVDQAYQALACANGVNSGDLSLPPAFPAAGTSPAGQFSAESLTAPPGRDQSSPATPAVCFEDLHFRYDNGIQALDGINLNVARGEWLNLVGANGSGKTTLAKHTNGLLRPQQGRVLVNGSDTSRKSTGELAHLIGYVFQNPDHQIFGATVWEEIAFGPRNVGLDEAEVTRRVELALATFDLAAIVDTPPATLGYGQRRLVTLASVHAMQPEILILDEPTIGLDRRLTSRVTGWVTDLNRAGATVLLITHDLRLISLAGHCAVLRRGQVILDGSTAALYSDAALLARADVSVPPIVQLAHMLDLPVTPLTVTDFCRVYTRGRPEVKAS